MKRNNNNNNNNNIKLVSWIKNTLKCCNNKYYSYCLVDSLEEI